MKCIMNPVWKEGDLDQSRAWFMIFSYEMIMHENNTAILSCDHLIYQTGRGSEKNAQKIETLVNIVDLPGWWHDFKC